MLSVFFPLKWGTQPSPQVALKHCWDGYTSLGPPEWQESVTLAAGLVSLGSRMRLADTKHPASQS